MSSPPSPNSLTSTPAPSPLPVTLRPATAADQPTIRALIRTVGINPLGLHWLRFTIAEHDGQFIGCAQLKPHGDGSLELASVAVWPQYHGRGVGQKLVQHLIAIAPQDLYLTCLEHNEAFYRRFGFSTVTDAPDRLPPDFRRIARFIRLLRPIFGRGRIMFRPQPPETPE